uniref:Uncharacterized protein n=1 Tax=Oryza sativa subsp. japonica TaxID=39947 RepID=Q69J57_ORYSJ|nr:hypothetical protein [Oryza sativa Japonica Group]BAD36710.1 hypothetical protein [Oryza sativa Japonica Group]
MTRARARELNYQVQGCSWHGKNSNNVESVYRLLRRSTPVLAAARSALATRARVPPPPREVQPSAAAAPVVIVTRDDRRRDRQVVAVLVPSSIFAEGHRSIAVVVDPNVSTASTSPPSPSVARCHSPVSTRCRAAAGDDIIVDVNAA